jgi:hypothetical protein
MVEQKVASMLKSYPTYLEKDILIEKFQEGRLSLEEAETLRCILVNEQEIAEKNNALAYFLVIARLDQIIKEGHRK